MMMGKKILFLLAIAAIAFYGCDKIEGSQFDDLTNVNTGQKVLIEEFTGHYCGNCPDGARKLEELKKIYGDTLVIVSEHLGIFANAKYYGKNYKYDFNTAAGKDIEALFPASSYPCGLINRRGKQIFTKNSWATQIEKELANIPKAILTIENKYDSVSHDLTINISIEYKKISSSTDYLCVYLTEDSIINYQRDDSKDPSDVPNYVFRHTLRAAITNTFGEAISTSTVKIGSTITKTYQYKIGTDVNGAEIKAKHCSVVAFMTNSSNYEVFQVDEKKVE